MSVAARALFFVICAVAPATAIAQPAILAVGSPQPNEHGWINGYAKVEYLCARAVNCPETTLLELEGAGQVVEVTVMDKAGETATTSVTLNIDRTAPAVSIQSGRAATTTGASVAVVAKASDEISGMRAATCNGRPAPIDAAGVIRCEVPLVAGANDVVVEVSDRAGNSGSAGFRIVRTGASPRLTIVPEALGMIVGQVTTVQVHDESGRPASHVTWHVDNPSTGDMSRDGRHVFSAKAPGTVTVTAITDSARTTAIVTVYAADRLPMGSTRWKIGTLQVTQTPDTQPLKPTTKNFVGVSQKPGAVMWIESVNWSTGWLNWSERPGTNSSEVPASIRELGNGGAVLVVDSNETGLSSIVRSAGAQWRYQSPGQIRPQMVVTRDGSVVAMERTYNGFTRLVVFDAATGRVVVRVPLPDGVHAAFNIRCIKGVHGARYIPAHVGPLNPETRNGVHFGIVVHDDREDFAVCDQVSGSHKRTVMIATVGEDAPRVDMAAVFEVSAGTAPPTIDLFEVTIDRHGARLLPWSVVSAGNPREYRVTRKADDGSREYSLPAAGKIWLSGRHDDLAVTTDGTQLIGFNAVTGQVILARTFPEGVRILSVGDERVVVVAGDTMMGLDFPRTPR